MNELILTTFDWVPEKPRGYVRDLRVRWALEEGGLPYRVASTSSQSRDATHLLHQPFGQVPWLTDGERSFFESGAILLHLGERSPALLPVESRSREEAIEWVFAALNSVEMATLPWAMMMFFGHTGESPQGKLLEDFVKGRLDRLEPVLAGREWLAGTFSVADILMADVLRLVEDCGGLNNHRACRAFVARAKSRPCFLKALADQMAHFAAAD